MYRGAPLGRTTTFAHDDADRVTKQTFADAREVNATYDASGNVATLTPPGQEERQRLWWWAIVALLAVVIGETVLGNRLSRARG